MQCGTSQKIYAASALWRIAPASAAQTSQFSCLKIQSGRSHHRDHVEDNRLVLHLLHTFDTASYDSASYQTTLVSVPVINQQHLLGSAMGCGGYENWNYA
jgi:hypothetical protein